MSPDGLMTGTIGVAQALCVTLEMMPYFSKSPRAFNTFGFTAKGTGLAFMNFGIASSLTVRVAVLSFTLPMP